MSETVSLELSRKIPATRLNQSIEIEANAEERAALAKRLHVESVDRLWATFSLKEGKSGQISVRGRFEADVVQACVVTLDPVPEKIVEEFDFLFADQVPELDEADMEADVIDPIENGQLEIGEPLVQTLALALDPYPRKDGVEFTGFELE